ncbi:intraflagellar transport protein 25 homolog [Mercenaria mercenaria]|uniref:intraflagellar transport protein 25 homolog n=1 Tax=Mercenaria mercenaria TaxID=6596 RepID=UPI001E1D6F43|nr:intraflagellar transport protein 25 homolog [Mercenaria mercenaria]
MFDVGHRGGGASIVLATSNDRKYPPENMIDGSEETFWTSTGLYPQEFIMGFGHMMDIQRVNLSSYNIRHIQVEKCDTQDPTSFEPLVEKDLPQTDGQLQHEDIEVRTQATYLRFIIDSGYDHFVAIHKLNIAGNALHG